MIVQIDYREKKLITLVNSILNNPKNEKLRKNIHIEVVNLDLGDIRIIDEQKNEILLIERKSINDLASSIVDKRYKEQSHRLFHTHIPNHNIIYLIEGRITELNSKYTRITQPALYSAMIVLQYHKGFSVFRTMGIEESAEYILRISDKIHREKKPGYYLHNLDNNTNVNTNVNTNNNTINNTDNNGNNDTVNNTDVSSNTIQSHHESYCVKRKKAENITPDNIAEIILSQIPGVSEKTAACIMKDYNSITDFVMTLHADKNCLDNIKMETSNGTYRKITTTAKNNIINYLLKKQNIIQI